MHLRARQGGCVGGNLSQFDSNCDIGGGAGAKVNDERHPLHELDRRRLHYIHIELM